MKLANLFRYPDAPNYEKENEELRGILREVRTEIVNRMCYFYGDQMRGPGTKLLKRIDRVLNAEVNES